jgi:hypothetical protein
MRSDVRREGRRGVEGRLHTTSAPDDRGLRAAHAHDLVVCPGEIAAAVTELLPGAAGETTERSEA